MSTFGVALRLAAGVAERSRCDVFPAGDEERDLHVDGRVTASD